MLARYCSPTLGRFLSFDPIGGNRRSSQSWNRYSYALNNPINYVDPEGLIAELFLDLQFVVFDEVTVEGGSYFDILDFFWMVGGFFSDFAPMGAPEIGPIGETTAPVFGLVQALNGRNELEMVRFGIDIGLVDTGGVPEFAIFLPIGGAGKAARMAAGGRRGAALSRAVPLKSFTARNFRTNLGRLTGISPSTAHAHHVFPKKFARRFHRLGIDVNDPRYGAWWETKSHLRSAAQYNARWDEFFRRPNPSAEGARQFARELAGEYGLTLHF